MKATQLKHVKKGEFFTLVEVDDTCEIPSKYVRVRGDYDRSTRRYSTHHFDDVCKERFMKGETIVFIDFTF